MSRSIISLDDEPEFDGFTDIDDDDDFDIDDDGECPDYEDVLRRQDDIDQLTSDFILGMLGEDAMEFDLADFGIDTALLDQIEDKLEDVLHEFGLETYRPYIDDDDKVHSGRYID